MDLVNDHVQQILKRETISVSDDVLELMKSPKSCFGLRYKRQAEACQKCNLVVEYQGSTMEMSELCEGIGKRATQAVKKGGDYVCDQCDRGFRDKSGYVNHMRHVHETRRVDSEYIDPDYEFSCQYSSDQCDYDVENETDVVRDLHEVVHHGSVKN